jgi:hypothetical protein
MKDNPVRLGIGELEKTEKPSSIEYARSIFFSTLAADASEVIDNLYGEPFATYYQFRKVRGGRITYLNLSQDSNPEPLYQLLHEWAGAYNLMEDWCLERALDACEWQSVPPDEYDPDDWEGGDWTNAKLGTEIFDTFLAESETQFRFEYQITQLTYETREQIKTDVRLEFEEALQAFLLKIESLAEQRGFVRVPSLFRPHHYQWLVNYQVKKMSCKSILEQYQEQCKSQDLPLIKSVKAVQKAINELARFIGLRLRYSGRGKKNNNHIY